MSYRNTPLSKTPLLAIILAWVTAAVGVFVSRYIWRFVGQQQPTWPFPALYFIEVMILYLATAWSIGRSRESAMRFAWAAVGAMFSFSILGLMSVGLNFLPFSLVFFIIALVVDIIGDGKILLHFGFGFLGVLTQFAIMMAGVGLSQVFHY